ncbi:hypothetical protein TNIN_362241 [Trichonephila inaurata madagascariensis]|uniref:BTB domain-containing protein n=1 Tax=Trichonephila inaurata madagascariensis TaxID=2747483 RepID=A0A8X6YMI2_9ARAC|nr:hypothetical protein TNIN_362241 [Trichonephila inaurata madagascariensis]
MNNLIFQDENAEQLFETDFLRAEKYLDRFTELCAKTDQLATKDTSEITQFRKIDEDGSNLPEDKFHVPSSRSKIESCPIGYLNKEVRIEQLIELARSGFDSGSPRKRDTWPKSVPDYGTASMFVNTSDRDCPGSDGYALKEEIERIKYRIISPSINKKVSTKLCTPPTEVSHFNKMLDLKEGFHCLYAEGILRDVKLRTTTQIFHAHKNIIYVRSPVFRAMFTTDIKENLQECVDITDLEDATVPRMLLYMYTNAMEDF